MPRRILFLLFLIGVYLSVGAIVQAKDKHEHKRQGRFGHHVLKGQDKTHHKPNHPRRFGVLIYERNAATFNFRLHAHGLQACQDYTLIYFPDPWPGDNLRCLGKGTTNRRGALRITNRIDLNTNLPAAYDENYPKGARLRLVLSADVDCDGERFIDWNPQAYLFETRLIHYTDTDVMSDYSGIYCLFAQGEGGEMLLNMDIEQNVSDIFATIYRFIFTGTVINNTMTLTGQIPDDLIFTIVITFTPDGESFSGTMSSAAESFNISGTKGPCYDYDEPVGDPQCILPVAEPGLVIGGQQFNSVTGGIVHEGLDFEFDTPLPTIIAPCDGVVVGINVRPISLGNLLVNVEISYNAQWHCSISFEPDSPDPVIANQQRAEIAVIPGQVLHKGDVLGRLVVPGDTEFPHIHWGLNRLDSGDNIPVCARDYLTDEARNEIDAMFSSFSLLPVCLPPP